MKTQKELKELYLNILKQNPKNNTSWLKYYMNKIGYIVELEDKNLYIIEKPRIKTEFCFGEHGYDYDDASKAAETAATSEKYFISVNMKNLEDEIKQVKKWPETNYDYTKKMYLLPHNEEYEGRKTMYTRLLTDYDGAKDKDTAQGRPVSKKDRYAIIGGYQEVQKRFLTRLKTYLKKYGMSKIHTWTYWADA